MESTGIKVLIADDHKLFAEALQTILETEEDIEVVGRAADGEEAVELAGALQPDVIVMDISMPVLDGFEATHRIVTQVPRARVLFLTGSAAQADVTRANGVGSAGYVTKDRIAAELVEAIRNAASGDARKVS